MGVEDHGQYRINLQSSNFDKIAIDINNIINVLKGSLQELDVHGTFRMIEKCTSGMQQMQKDDIILMEDVKKNEKYIEELHKQCEEERQQNIKTIEATHNEIQKLRFDVEETECERIVHFYYV